ncbi:hypothetical protein D3C74_356450 [compost metagenome]
MDKPSFMQPIPWQTAPFGPIKRQLLILAVSEQGVQNSVSDSSGQQTTQFGVPFRQLAGIQRNSIVLLFPTCSGQYQIVPQSCQKFISALNHQCEPAVHFFPAHLQSIRQVGKHKRFPRFHILQELGCGSLQLVAGHRRQHDQLRL